MKNEYIGVFKKDARNNIIWTDRHDFEKLLKDLPEGSYYFSISKYTGKRTIEQNRLYWKILAIVSDYTGYEKDELHEIFKYKFLKRSKQDENTGEIFEYIKTTTKLKIPEFSDYIDKVKRYCTINLGCKFPENLT